MISLKRSINENERQQCLSAATQDLLLSTLESVERYVIRTDAASVEQFRDSLIAIHEKVRECLDSRDADTLGRSRSDVRRELRDYHDRAERYIDHIRTELHNTGKALTDLLGVCQAGTGAEQRLNDQVNEIRYLETAQSLEHVRITARRIAASIAECAEEMKHEKDGIIAQLRDEIRTLQKAVDDAQRAARVGVSTGCYSRDELERQIRREIVSGRAFVLLHIWLRNFEQLRDAFSVGIIDELAASFVRRVAGLAQGAVLGRWQSDVFCVVTDSDTAKDLGADVLRTCSGNYLCTRNNVSQNLKLQLAVTHVVPQPEDELEVITQKIERLNAKQRE